MLETHDKGPIRFLEKHIIKQDRKNNLEIVATLFSNKEKWIANKDIDNQLSNDFWTNMSITNSQKMSLKIMTQPIDEKCQKTIVFW